MTAEAGNAGCVPHAAAPFPDYGPQHAAPIEGITGEEIENGQQQVSRADEEEKCRTKIELQKRGQHHSAERDQPEDKTRRRPSHSNAKLRARVLGLRAQARQTAKRMQHDLFDLDSLCPPHQGV